MQMQVQQPPAMYTAGNDEANLEAAALPLDLEAEPLPLYLQYHLPPIVCSFLLMLVMIMTLQASNQWMFNFINVSLKTYIRAYDNG